MDKNDVVLDQPATAKGHLHLVGERGHPLLQFGGLDFGNNLVPEIAATDGSKITHSLGVGNFRDKD